MKSSKSSKRKFVHGTFVYHYDLVRQERATLGLTVMPDLSISLRSPHEASIDRIETFLKRKWFWLEKQLSFFRKYQRRLYPKEYISGESFLYLGRQYQLLVKQADRARVVLSKKQINLGTTGSVSDGGKNKKILEGWYKSRTINVFTTRLRVVAQQFGLREAPELIIREMPKRWGSLLSTGKIVLNPRLIYTSKECIDYVIVHELCHVKFKNHDKKFFELLEEKCPKWRKVKEKLEMYKV